jgi:hypothetical protein
MQENSDFGLSTYPSSGDVLDLNKELEALLGESPIPDKELVEQFALYATTASLRRFLYLDKLYQQILHLPGTVMLFGVRWGRDLATFQALAQIYEPMNYTRRVVGFDTFSGFPSVHALDGSDAAIRPGSYGVTDSFEEHLSKVLAVKRKLGTYAHVDRAELRKGDAPGQLKAYLAERPETVVAFAYFDFDLYEPTKDCATLLAPFLTRGSIVAFDEFIHPVHPGETVAAREVFGSRAAFRRIPNTGPGHSGYFVFDELPERR